MYILELIHLLKLWEASPDKRDPLWLLRLQAALDDAMAEIESGDSRPEEMDETVELKPGDVKRNSAGVYFGELFGTIA